ncbi:flagellar biosynthesis regulator FlaF [Dongia deserti]|uniref:flagellar biosynthesis regulator FlaF n=1 Tax=Dongia deserti TaxID=2268030 RepID=UPI000E64F35F|nr:flagellar biosynthesis regulator FlaF [Dongia deserti]
MKAPNAYVSRPSGDDPRSTEAWALGEASRRLALAAKMNDNGDALREALRLNQRLWSIFQAALSEPECPLPKDVRDNVLALSVMIDRHSMARLADLDGSKIGPILDINRAIAEGLSAKPAQPAANAPAARPAAPAPGAATATPVMRVSA